MNTIQKRFSLFAICILFRLFLVLIAKYIKQEYLKYFSIIGAIIGLSFIYLYFTKSRLTGAEVFGGKIWWHKFRIIHGLLYLTFAYLCLNIPNKAWIPLLIDVILGFIFFIHYHYTQDNFIKL